jgi:hypothetical protein
LKLYSTKRATNSDRCEQAERRASKKSQLEVEANLGVNSPEEDEEILGVEIQTNITGVEMEEICKEISSLRTSEENSMQERDTGIER